MTIVRWYIRMNQRIFQGVTDALQPVLLPLAFTMTTAGFFFDGFLGWYLSLGGAALALAWWADRR